MKNFSVISINKHDFVICSVLWREGYPDPNFAGTNMALCGVLKKGETLKEWKSRNHKR